MIVIRAPTCGPRALRQHRGERPLLLEGTYFSGHRFEGVDERDGLRMHFAGWSQPLEAYATALEGAGLAITSLREPRPDFDHGRNHMARWTRIPLFLRLKARPPAY